MSGRDTSGINELRECNLSHCESDKVISAGVDRAPKSVGHGSSSRPDLLMDRLLTHNLGPDWDFTSENATSAIFVVRGLKIVNIDPGLHWIALKFTTVFVSKTAIEVVVINRGHHIVLVRISIEEIFNFSFVSPVHKDITILISLIEGISVRPIDSTLLRAHFA